MSKQIIFDSCYNCPKFSYCTITNIGNDHEAIDPNCPEKDYEEVLKEEIIPESIELKYHDKKSLPPQPPSDRVISGIGFKTPERYKGMLYNPISGDPIHRKGG